MTPSENSHQPRSLFMAGIGGMGMAPLALHLRGAGWEIVGGDDNLQPAVGQMLTNAGVRIAETIPDDAERLVYSSALSSSHRWLETARLRSIRIQRRGEFLAEWTKDKRVLAIAGSHGKTTTSAAIIDQLQRNDIPCSYVLGGLFADERPSGAWLPEPCWTVLEIDESDGTIDLFSPAVTVIVNFDWDHADRYHNQKAIEDAFCGLANRTQLRLILPATSTIPAQCPDGPQVHSFSVSRDFRLTNFEAARVACEAVAAIDGASHALPGVLPELHRRQELLFKGDGLEVLTDYAHHPTEVAALLDWLGRSSPGKLTVVFQPHRFTRTRQFAADFARSLSTVDDVLLMPVYPASEPFDPLGTTAAIAKAGNDWPVLDPAEVRRELSDLLFHERTATPRIVAFIGAGDIDATARSFAADLCAAGQLASCIGNKERFKLQEPLGPKTTMRVGGNARFYAEPESISELMELLQIANQIGIPHFLMGRGSNLIVADLGFNGLVLHLSHGEFAELRLLDDGCIRAGAGVRLKQLCAFAAESGLAGFEFLEGIPGTVGGSLRMNAGAMGAWIFDRVERVTVAGNNYKSQIFPKQVFTTSYRSCPQLIHNCALQADFRPTARNSTKSIRERMRELTMIRKASQPREPSAGCIFKNPPGASAGKLIDEIHLKGLTIGRAQVSPKHANFIVNLGGATASDVLQLVCEVRKRVLDETGIALEPEALLLGTSWTEVLGSQCG